MEVLVDAPNNVWKLCARAQHVSGNMSQLCCVSSLLSDQRVWPAAVETQAACKKGSGCTALIEIREDRAQTGRGIGRGRLQRHKQSRKQHARRVRT